MTLRFYFAALLLSVTSVLAAATFSPSPNPSSSPALSDCAKSLRRLPGVFPDAEIEHLCASAQQLNPCISEQGRPIVHIDRAAVPQVLTHGARGPKKILVFGLTHGDEPASGALARHWLLRLGRVDPRNQWRIVPVLNPDGLELKTRANSHGVDLNRNFPTRDWDQNAVKFWKMTTHSNPRRFPGPHGASESETRCAMEQIKDFKPDLIVSVHTPYGLIDFDGPKTALPVIKRLPIRRLGSFPGSLGRYMWQDRKIPVMTVELRPGDVPIAEAEADQLQDAIGALAAKAAQ